MIVVAGAAHCRGRAGQAGLQGFSRGQGTTAFRGADFVDIPVPQGRGGHVVRGGLQGFSQGQGSTACSGAESSDIPVPQSRGGGEVFSNYAQTRIQLLHPRALMPWMRLLQVFFRTRGRNWVRILILGLRRLMRVHGGR